MCRIRCDEPELKISAERRLGTRLSIGLRVVWRPRYGPTRERAVRMFIHRRPRGELPHLAAERAMSCIRSRRAGTE